MTGGVAVADVAASLCAQQTTCACTAGDNACGVAVADVAQGAGSDQTTSSGTTADAAGVVAVADAACRVASQQAARTGATRDTTAQQPDVADRAVTAGSAKQSNIRNAGAIDGEATHRVA